MPRLVKKFAHEPVSVKGVDICMCGLSQNQPYCDKSHKKTLDEDDSKLYVYTKTGQRKEVHFEEKTHSH